jgi:hypothetical protein
MKEDDFVTMNADMLREFKRIDWKIHSPTQAMLQHGASIEKCRQILELRQGRMILRLVCLVRQFTQLWRFR